MESFEESVTLDDMSTDDFRSSAHQLIEWIANYSEQIETFPVLSKVEPGDIRSRCESRLKSEGESYQDIFHE